MAASGQPTFLHGGSKLQTPVEGERERERTRQKPRVTEPQKSQCHLCLIQLVGRVWPIFKEKGLRLPLVGKAIEERSKVILTHHSSRTWQSTKVKQPRSLTLSKARAAQDHPTLDLLNMREKLNSVVDMPLSFGVFWLLSAQPNPNEHRDLELPCPVPGTEQVLKPRLAKEEWMG